ncbi:MAG TPA: PDZ domain-containing protein [Blastocatellia bacterium]|nr:PDZ domain-containing protein [Blastocatellia bacterium]
MTRNLLMAVAVVLASAGIVQAQSENRDGASAVQILVRGDTFLGVQLAEVDRALVQRLKLREERGALVTGIMPGSSAEKAGLQKDDVVVRWNGERIESAVQLQRHIRESPADRTVRLGVMRGGREIEVDVKLGRQSDHPGAFRVDDGEGNVFWEHARLGIELHGLTPQLAQHFGLPTNSGALVASVDEDSPAAKAGLRAGDVIVSVGGEEVSGPFDLRSQIRRRHEGPVEVKILRDRQEQTITLEVTSARRPGSLGIFDFHGVEMTAPRVVLPSMKLGSVGPIVVPRIHVRPITPTVVPRIKVAPVAPMVIPGVQLRRIAPMTITVPKVIVPRIRMARPGARVLV